MDYDKFSIQSLFPGGDTPDMTINVEVNVTGPGGALRPVQYLATLVNASTVPWTTEHHNSSRVSAEKNFSGFVGPVHMFVLVGDPGVPDGKTAISVSATPHPF